MRGSYDAAIGNMGRYIFDNLDAQFTPRFVVRKGLSEHGIFPNKDPHDDKLQSIIIVASPLPVRGLTDLTPLEFPRIMYDLRGIYTRFNTYFTKTPVKFPINSEKKKKM